jgi:hypothetical protein
MVPKVAIPRVLTKYGIRIRGAIYSNPFIKDIEKKFFITLSCSVKKVDIA